MDSTNPPSLAQPFRVLLAIAIGLVAGGLSALLRLVLHVRAVADDMYWPFCAARAVVEAQDPYAVCVGTLTTNMLPTALLLIPLLPLGALAPSLLWGVGNGVLAYGLLREGRPWRLLIFLSGAYWQAAWWLQWSPLILAIALTPALYPLLWLKPHIAIPTALLRFRLPGFVAAGLIGALSLVLAPSWPAAFVARLGGYTGQVPALLAPYLLLAGLAWRREAARWLLLSSLVPLRGMYDLCVLWPAVTSRRSALLFVAGSWAWLISNTLWSLLVPLTLLLAHLLWEWRLEGELSAPRAAREAG